MNIFKQVCCVGFLSLAVGIGPMVAAQPGPMSPGPVPFATYDKDGDGRISEAEFNAVRKARQKEKASRGGAMRGAPAAPSFDQFDSDGDGQLTPGELMAGQRSQAAQRSAEGRNMGKGKGMGQGPGMNRPAFEDYDMDGNGAISEQEFNKARGERISDRASEGYAMRNLGRAPTFAEIDSNGDGEISPAEFAEHQQSRP